VSACCNGAYTPLYNSTLVLLSAAAPVEQLHAHTGAHLLSGQHTTTVEPTGFLFMLIDSDQLTLNS
jgi:hypothetical protein